MQCSCNRSCAVKIGMVNLPCDSMGIQNFRGQLYQSEIGFRLSQDVLKYYGASRYGSGPPALGTRSPRNSYNPEADDFERERGSYQNEFEHP